MLFIWGNSAPPNFSVSFSAQCVLTLSLSGFLQPAQDFGTFFSAVIDDKVSSPLLFLPAQEGNTTRLSLSVMLNGVFLIAYNKVRTSVIS